MSHARCISPNGKSHFFGYYGINPWDAAGRMHLCLETNFDGRRPGNGDTALVGAVDAVEGGFTAYAETRAFNFQQGAMLNRLDDKRIIHNTVDGDEIRAVIRDIGTGAARLCERPVAALSPDRSYFMGLDYKRNFLLREVVGYDIGQKGPVTRSPADNGLFFTETENGESRLVLSIAELLDRFGHPDDYVGAWFDHVVINPSGRRLFFMCRLRKATGGWYSSLWTVRPDGSELRQKIDFKPWISHFDWMDDRTILVSTDELGKPSFLLIDDETNAREPFFQGVMPRDGHACFSPDRRFLLSDSVPGPDNTQELFIIDIAARVKRSLGFFPHDQKYRGDIRCDLHPRWRSDQTLVTFDSVYQGERQIYAVDVSDITKA